MLPSWRAAALCGREMVGPAAATWASRYAGASYSSTPQPPDPSHAAVPLQAGEGLGPPPLPPQLHHHLLGPLPHLDPALLPEHLEGALAACATSEPQQMVVVHVFSILADSLDSIHTATGLPWWAAIPLTTLGLKIALMPLSLLQAKIVRTNFGVYKMAHALAKKQQAEKIGALGPKAGSGSTHGVSSSGKDQAGADNHHATISERIELAVQTALAFRMLRNKIGAPHPAWILLNGMAQIPPLMLAAMTLRQMAHVDWPGFSTQGALWFHDLTQVALRMDSLDTPMGIAGFILPLTAMSMTLTSIRLGVGASGVRSSLSDHNDRFSQFLQVLPKVLYTLTVASLYLKVQQPQAALLHWNTSTAFTLSLQLALKNPTFQTLTHIPTWTILKERLMLARKELWPEAAEGQQRTEGPIYSTAALPADLVQKVSNTGNADILVIMGAQLSAQHRFPEAMYCFDKALLISPKHVRAHYSRGQVFSMTKMWVDAERSFLEAAEHEVDTASKGQSLYCAGSAIHSQGRLDAAIDVYEEAVQLWQDQPVTQWALANALTEVGRHQDALGVVDKALALKSSDPFRKVLEELRTRLIASPAKPFSEA